MTVEHAFRAFADGMGSAARRMLTTWADIITTGGKR